MGGIREDKIEPQDVQSFSSWCLKTLRLPHLIQSTLWTRRANECNTAQEVPHGHLEAAKCNIGRLPHDFCAERKLDAYFFETAGKATQSAIIASDKSAHMNNTWAKVRSATGNVHDARLQP